MAKKPGQDKKQPTKRPQKEFDKYFNNPPNGLVITKPAPPQPEPQQ